MSNNEENVSEEELEEMLVSSLITIAKEIRDAKFLDITPPSSASSKQLTAMGNIGNWFTLLSRKSPFSNSVMVGVGIHLTDHGITKDAFDKTREAFIALTTAMEGHALYTADNEIGPTCEIQFEVDDGDTFETPEFKEQVKVAISLLADYMHFVLDSNKKD